MERLISLEANTLQSFCDRPETILTEDLPLQIAISIFPETPRNLLEILANSNNPEVAEAARLHVNYAGELEGNWQDVVDEQFKNRYLGQNDRLAVELLKIAPVPAYFLSEYVPSEYLTQGLNNPHLPLRYRLQLLTRLAQEPTLEPRLQVAESPDTPLPVLEQLIGDLELSIRIAVEYNPNCPSALVELVTGQHKVASNWDTDTQQLDSLSHSNWDWIRLAVAQNPSTSEETLLKLAGDKVFKIQLAVAKNPVTSANVLAVLAEYSSKEIQAEIAKHPNATEEILHSLFDSQQGIIRSKKNLPVSIIEKVFDRRNTNIPLWKDTNIRYFLLKQPNTPTWILAEFTNIDIEELTAERLVQERKNNSTPGIHKEWVSDDIKFLVDVAKHPQVSQEILDILAQFPDSEVRLAANRKPESNLDLIIQQSTTSGKILAEIIDKAENYQKKNIARHPNICEATLALLAKDSSPRVRLAVAQNPLTNNDLRIQILKILITDKSQMIRAAIAGWSKTPIYLLKQIVDDLLLNSKPETLICAALIGNLNTPVDLKLKVIEYISPIELNSLKDLEIGIALKLNFNLIKNQSLDKLSFIGLNDLAKSPDTPVYLLEQIAQLEIESSIYLAENPSTPSEILVKLARQFVRKSINNNNSNLIPEKILQNPNLPIIEKHKLFITKKEQKEIEKTNQILAQKTDNPYALARVLETGDQKVKISVASNYKTPIQVLEQLAQDEDENIRQTVAQNPNISLEIAIKLAQDRSSKVQLSLVKSKIELPPEVLHKLAQTRNEFIRKEIAKNKNTPPIILRYLASDRQTQLEVLKNPNTPRDILAEYIPQITNEKQIESILRGTDYTQQKNPQMPSNVLEILSHHPKDVIRYLVALYPTASITTLKRLAFDNYHMVRQTVAGNPNTPSDTLIEMAKKNVINTTVGSAHSVPYIIAERKDATPEALNYLARQPVSTVRSNVVRNNNTSLETLEWLIDNESDANILSIIAQNTKLTPELQEKLASNLSNKVRHSLATNPNATAETLSIIYLTMMTAETDIEVHLAVASHPNTPVDFIENLSIAKNSAVRAGVASNPNAPQYLIEKLAQDESVEVHRAVANNSNSPEAIRNSLKDLLPTTQNNTQSLSPTLRGLSRIYNPNTDDLPTVLSEYINSEVAFVRFISLLHPLMPTEILETAANSISWIERYAVADNPNTPTEIRQQLTQDSNQIVRVVARDKLAV
jgi:hypothetical protein